jgi:signal transduction histidine kinase
LLAACCPESCATVSIIAGRREIAALANGHYLRAELPDGPLTGWWDGDRLAQVMQNLLTNAIKYSPEGGEIVFRIEDRGYEARVSVSDQGIGITSEARSHLFGPFYRAEGALTLGVQGPRPLHHQSPHQGAGCEIWVDSERRRRQHLHLHPAVHPAAG